MLYKVTLNNRVYEVEVEAGEAMLVDEYDAIAPAAPAPAAAAPVAAALAPAAAPAAPVSADGHPINAPMPGNILKIVAEAGQKVAEGDTIMILEALKMENEIVADKAGTVGQILVNKGQSVETGTLLATIV